MRGTLTIIGIMVMFLITGLAQAAAPPEATEDAGYRTPPRLAYVDGQVSFWRPGADDWVEAQVNTALAPGDQLFAGPDGTLELQIGPQAFLRGGAGAQVGLERQEEGLLHFKLTAGQAALDLRSLEAGELVAVDTPQASFTMEREGAYRLGVNDERTILITRRGGQATATLADGDTLPIGAGEAVTIDDASPPRVASRDAPPPDAWDTWNDTRTEELLAAASTRYVSPGTYGAEDLDRYGSWQNHSTYGPVWAPAGVPADWAPYSTGAWIRDPYYGWTWVDTAPWGWAPYHYGRWVVVGSRWCWAPGPRLIRPVYAPALVGFYGGPGVHVGVSIGGPVVGWVALGWGEPLVPWWGRSGFIHRPWWGGWGGPRLVNNRVIHHRSVVHVRDIHVYRHSRERHAVVAVRKPHFGRGPITRARISTSEVRNLRPVHTAPRVAATPASLVPSTRLGPRPPEHHLKRTVVSSRALPNRRQPASTREASRDKIRTAPGSAPRVDGPPVRRFERGSAAKPLENRTAVREPRRNPRRDDMPPPAATRQGPRTANPSRESLRAAPAPPQGTPRAGAPRSRPSASQERREALKRPSPETPSVRQAPVRQTPPRRGADSAKAPAVRQAPRTANPSRESLQAPAPPQGTPRAGAPRSRPSASRERREAFKAPAQAAPSFRQAPARQAPPRREANSSKAPAVRQAPGGSSRTRPPAAEVRQRRPTPGRAAPQGEQRVSRRIERSVPQRSERVGNAPRGGGRQGWMTESQTGTRR
jgi:hypothetical protein